MPLSRKLQKNSNWQTYKPQEQHYGGWQAHHNREQWLLYLFEQSPHCCGAKQFIREKHPPAHANCHASCKNTLPQIPKSGIGLRPPRRWNKMLLSFSSHPVATRREETNPALGVFPSREQKAADIIYWIILWTSGYCVTSELSEMSPEGAGIAKGNGSCCGDFLAYTKPFSHFEGHQLNWTLSAACSVTRDSAGTQEKYRDFSTYPYSFSLALQPKAEPGNTSSFMMR